MGILREPRETGDILKKKIRESLGGGRGVLKNTEQSTRAPRRGEDSGNLGYGGGGKVGGMLR